jgi:Tfp pilus assembly PilM family ATPase
LSDLSSHAVEQEALAMPNLIGLEWDSREVRMMIASGRGRQVVIEQAFSVRLDREAPAVGLAEQIGGLIASELDARGLGRPDTVVAVGRSSIELRQLQLPPAADDDLPDLVRFQAMREFNEFDDRWQLDYLPIEGSAESPRTVLATAIGPAAFELCKAVCDRAGLKMRRLLLRPCESALLLKSGRPSVRGQLALLVNLLGSEAELTAVVDGRAVFLHTARNVGDAPLAQALLAAIRLTIAAVPNQLGGRRIESIVVCGLNEAHRELARTIESELDIRVELFDQFQNVQLGRVLADSPPDDVGRFTALTGMLLTELAPSEHAVDFLHPRRRTEKPDPRKKWFAVAAVAAALLLVWFIYSRVEHYLLDCRVKELAQQVRDLDKSLDEAKRAHAKVAEVVRWADEDVNWLDRFYALNQSFPPAEEAMLGEATASTSPRSEMSLRGWVARHDNLARLAENVRAHGYKMNQKTSGDDHSATAPYTSYFEASVLAEKGEKP